MPPLTDRWPQEVIGVGQHGLMRMMSGDWSDLIMSRVGIGYNSPRYKHALTVSESSLNTAMASRVFDRCETTEPALRSLGDLSLQHLSA